MSPDGERWKVGRQWSPWRPRLRPSRRRGEDAAVEGSQWGLDGAMMADDLLGGVLVGLAFAAVVVLAFVVVWPVIAIAAEIAIVVLGVILGTAWRIAFRKPWIVRASAMTYRDERVWEVKGWRASGQMIDAVSSALERGLPLPLPPERRL